MLSSMIQKVKGSSTIAITEKVVKKKEGGTKVYSFGAGEPDFDTPDNIKEAAYKAIREGYTKYAPTAGVSEFKDEIAKKFKVDNNLDYTSDQVIVCNGAKQAVATAVFCLCQDGNEVILPQPYWVSYPEIVKMGGGVPKGVKASPDFQLDISEIEKAINPKTKIIIINTPNNPTGAVYKKEELEALSELVIKNDLYVVSDEVYEKLIFDDNKHVSLAEISDEMKDRTVVVNGVSKAYAMTGWRIGYAAGPLELIKAMGRFQGHFTSNANTIAQKASVEALRGDQSSVQDMLKAYQERRDFMHDYLSKLEGVGVIKPRGAFYMMVDVSKKIGLNFRGSQVKDDFKFAELLLDNYDVAVVPGTAFEAPGQLRLSFATSLENITEGLSRFKDFVYSIN